MNTGLRSIYKIFFSVLGIITLLEFFSGCSAIPKGNLAFIVEITGYTAESGIEVDLRLDHSTNERTLEGSADIGPSDSGSLLFGGIDEGEWIVSVTVRDGDAFLGEEQFSVHARRGETVASTIGAVYTEGSLRFSISSESTVNGQSMELEDFESLITAGRRVGMIEPDVGIRAVAFGSFASATYVELTYPDGLEVTAGTKATFDGVYFNVHDSSMDFFRPEYRETGDFSLVIEDVHGNSLIGNDSLDFLSDDTFFPVITTPPDDFQQFNVLANNPVMWNNGNAPEAKTVGILVYLENQPENLLYRDISLDPQGMSSFTVPAGELPVGYHRVIIFTLDIPIDDISILDDFDNYRAVELPYQFAKHFDANITGVAYFERRVEGI